MNIYMTRAVLRLERCPRAGLLILSSLLFACGGEPPEVEVHDEDAGVVHLTTEQVDAAGIVHEPVARGPVVEGIEATAVVEPAADAVARISSRVAGRVERVEVNVGDSVRAAEPLLVIDSPDLGRTKADYLAALAAREVTAEIAARERELYRDRITSQRDLLRAEAEADQARARTDAAENRLHALGLSEEDLEDLATERHYSSLIHLASPISGVVAARNASMGEMVDAVDELLTVMDLRTVWVVIDVYEQELARVRRGLAVRASTRAFPDRVFEGVIDNVGAVLEPNSRAVRVRVVLPNPDGALRPGMFAQVSILLEEEGPTRLRVPVGALQRDGDEAIVFVRVDEGEYERRVVRVLAESVDWVAVDGDIREGESVATAGVFVLKSELQREELADEDGH